MTRMAIRLTPEQAEGVRRFARAESISESEFIRRAIDRMLEDESRLAWERAKSVVGKFHDREGKTDVARNHDKYLAEAVEAEWRES